MTKIQEHFAPSRGDDYLTLQHIERYRFAISLLKSGMKILDIASGDGYGTAMLSKCGMDVIGCDYNEELVTEAGARWSENKFLKADALALPFEDSSFDAVVSFETIEHVLDGRRFLSEMNRVLRPGGIFICSTPNIAYTAHPEFHVKEYEPEEFYGLASRIFNVVERHGQYFTLNNRINDLYMWLLRPRLLYLLEKTGTKEGLKRLIRRNRPVASNPPQYKGYEWIDSLLRLRSDERYAVRPYEGARLLRIMLVVARKQGLNGRG